MKKIKKSELSLILKDIEPQSIVGEVHVDREHHRVKINIEADLIKKEPKLMESKMSKEEMTQFSLIIKEAITESNKTVLSRLDGIEKDIKQLKSDMVEVKLDINKLKSDMVEVKTDIKAMKNTPTMKKELGL